MLEQHVSYREGIPHRVYESTDERAHKIIISIDICLTYVVDALEQKGYKEDSELSFDRFLLQGKAICGQFVKLLD